MHLFHSIYALVKGMRQWKSTIGSKLPREVVRHKVNFEKKGACGLLAATNEGKEGANTECERMERGN